MKSKTLAQTIRELCSINKRMIDAIDSVLDNVEESDSLINFATPEMYGAKGDGETNDLNAFLEMADKSLIVLRKEAIYRIDSDETYIFSKDKTILGNGATIHITFSGNDAPRMFYGYDGATFHVSNCKFIVDVSQGSSRSRLFDCPVGSAELDGVSVVVNNVPGDEKTSVAEVNKLIVKNCNIVNNSGCTTDGGTLWAKGTDSELSIENSYIEGSHHDEVIANYGTGVLKTQIRNCKIISSSKITVRSISDEDSRSTAEISNCELTYTNAENRAFDVGHSTNSISVSYCTFHGEVSNVFSSSSNEDRPVDCYVNDCDFSDLTYTRFIDASLAISLYMNNTDVGTLMTAPQNFLARRIALTNCHVANTVLMSMTSNETPETLTMDILLQNCIVDAYSIDRRTKTVNNPHLMINSFLEGNYVNRYI